MADIKVERKGGTPWLWWIVGIIVLILIIWGIWSWAAGPDTDDVVVPADTTLPVTTPAPVVPPADTTMGMPADTMMSDTMAGMPADNAGTMMGADTAM
ncbi:MAG TPA: hypothetical protein VFI96_00615 [Longimicrobiaceae bacterium]|nr:hypothetical protein [Longimicrobiaceae bacterium]